MLLIRFGAAKAKPAIAAEPAAIFMNDRREIVFRPVRIFLPAWFFVNSRTGVPSVDVLFLMNSRLETLFSSLSDELSSDIKFDL